MKIAQVICTYPPYRGGMGNIAYEYTERLRSRGHDVHVFTPRLAKPVEEDPPYVHRITSPIHWGNAGVTPSLYKRLSGFDIVHLHYPFFGGAEPVIVRKALKKTQALVMTYHMDVVGNGLKGALFDMHRRLLFPWIVERADRILVSSREYAETSALASVPGIMEKVSVHPFGIDTEAFYPGEEPELRSELDIGEDEVVIIFVGGLDKAHYFKGLPNLIESLSRLSALHWKCLIIGDGDLRATYEARAEDSGCFRKMRFLGSVSDEEKQKCFRLADLHVFPSIDRSEAFGLVSLEAAASGIPSVVSELPGVTSVVKHGQTGLYVKPDDVDSLAEAIRKLITDHDLREKMGAAARVRAETHFAWPKLLDLLEEEYQSVLSELNREKRPKTADN